MGRDKFENFLNNTVVDTTQPPIDWEKQKREWLQYANELYQRIDLYLEKYVQDGKISIDKGKITLFEEELGHYEIEMRLIRVGGKEIKLTPIGTLLIGSKGRIDMESRSKSVRFVLVANNATSHGFARTPSNRPRRTEHDKDREQIQWTWKIVNPPPHIKFAELNEDSFFDALMSVING